MENGGGGAHTSGRGRGRPRASYAQTGELDLSLIREYRSRPSLYDRNSKRFKDKMFTAQQWQMISHKLGYDVSLLKDRMLQLRNRYNIEKRRLEQTREENNDDNIESPWPLFDTLSFLSDHIRSRRSYKHFDKKPSVNAGSGIEYENSDENYDMQDDETEHSNGGAGELMADVKVEMSTGSTDDEYEQNDAEQQLPVATVLKAANTNIPNGALTMIHANCFERRGGETTTAAEESKGAVASEGGEHSLNLLPPSITLRRVDNNNKYLAASSAQHHLAAAAAHQQNPYSLNGYGHYNKSPSIANTITLPKQAVTSNSSSSQSQNAAPTISLDDDTDDVVSTGDYTMPPPPKRHRPNSDKCADKYRAFGEFVSSSLLDLPPRKALRLVEKFTSELVQSLMQHADGGVVSERHVNATCSTDEISNGGCNGV